VNFIAEVAAFSAMLYLVPVLLLFGAGLAIGRRTAGEQDYGDAAAAGATVVAGYLPLAVIGAVLVQVQSGSSTAGPDLLLAVVLAGLVYPAVLGALGSVVAFATQS
jgi:cytochrome c biogenesis protein CcdA